MNWVTEFCAHRGKHVLLWRTTPAEVTEFFQEESVTISVKLRWMMHLGKLMHTSHPTIEASANFVTRFERVHLTSTLLAEKCSHKHINLFNVVG
mmetsp:Transcript_138772/g.245201  ORF Transcript_138772/g.245201 Transcript_138772/m.245201 type:complete len:94 (-) Transcript_138772:24-305(-)